MAQTRADSTEAPRLTTEYVRDVTKRPPATGRDVRDAKQHGLILRVRPSGTHTYRVQLGRGRSHTLGLAADLTLEQARLLARGVRGDVSTAKALGHPDPIEARKQDAAVPTFEAFVRDTYTPWAVAQRKTGAEQAARLTAIFGPTLAGLALTAISPFVVERWRSARLKAGTTAATVNRDLTVLRGALSRAVEWGLLATHPLAKVKPSKTDTRAIVRFLTADEDKRLRDALTARDDERRAERERANDWRAVRGYARWPALGLYTDHLHPLVLLALHTGLRRGELFQLRWRDVVLVGTPQVTVRGDGAKSGQTRHIPLNSVAVRVLTSWLGDDRVAPAALVFPSPVDPDKPLEDIKSAWLPLMRAARITGFRFHDLRHTFASRLVQAAVDLNTVRELLGHADLKMTLRYSHLQPEHRMAAVQKLVGAGA